MKIHIDGWQRLAIVFTVFWLAITVCIASYERFTTGPWDYYENNELIFYYWLENLLEVKPKPELFFNTHRFWSVLLLPIAISWILAVFLKPVIKWIYRGFQKETDK